jgi:hypothetical protein
MKFVFDIIGWHLPQSVPALSSHRERGPQRSVCPKNWSDEDVFRLRTLGEPLVADSRVSSEEERAAFSKAINAYLLNGQPENLEAFLRQWPESRWAAALEHNLGLLKYPGGFLHGCHGVLEERVGAGQGLKGSATPRPRQSIPCGACRDAGVTWKNRGAQATFGHSQGTGGGRIGPSNAGHSGGCAPRDGDPARPLFQVRPVRPG